MYPKQTVEIKVTPRLKGIDEEFNGEFEIGDSHIDPKTGELVVDVIPSQSEKVDFE